MEFLRSEDSYSIEERIEVLERNKDTASRMRIEMERLKEEPTSIPKIEEKEEREEIELEEVIETNDFEDEIDYYLDDYRKLQSIDKESIREILPSRNNFDYHKILLRLMSESLKEIREFEEMADEEEDVFLLQEIKENVLWEQRKIEALKEFYREEEQEEIIEEKNQVILPISPSGNIKIMDDLEHIPEELYSGFEELISSIENGTFKGVKRLVSDLSTDISICEVRGDGIRILFHRLNHNTYALVSAFQKKTYANKGYKEFLRNRIFSYKQGVEELKRDIENPSFLEKNQENIEDLRKLLRRKEEKGLK